jgi:hypothetical protein
MDAPRPAEFGSTVRRTRAVRGIGTALCLFALLSLLTVRTAEVSHHPVHRAAAITAAADSSIQVRAAQPLAVAAPGAVAPTLVATVAEHSVPATRDCVPVGTVRTRGPPGLA